MKIIFHDSDITFIIITFIFMILIESIIWFNILFTVIIITFYNFWFIINVDGVIIRMFFAIIFIIIFKITNFITIIKLTVSCFLKYWFFDLLE